MHVDEASRRVGRIALVMKLLLGRLCLIPIGLYTLLKCAPDIWSRLYLRFGKTPGSVRQSRSPRVQVAPHASKEEQTTFERS